MTPEATPPAGKGRNRVRVWAVILLLFGGLAAIFTGNTAHQPRWAPILPPLFLAGAFALQFWIRVRMRKDPDFAARIKAQEAGERARGLRNLRNLLVWIVIGLTLMALANLANAGWNFEAMPRPTQIATLVIGGLAVATILNYLQRGASKSSP